MGVTKLAENEALYSELSPVCDVSINSDNYLPLSFLHSFQNVSHFPNETIARICFYDKHRKGCQLSVSDFLLCVRVENDS